MNPQLSQDYDVDSRYHGMKRAQDNDAGKQFVSSFLKRRELEKPSEESELRQEDRFFVTGPGNTQYTFRNAFRASK